MSTNRLVQHLKNMYHYLQAQWWRAYYGWPDRQLTLYGVTGTNGKTTTSLVLGSILRVAYGRATIGVLTTELFWFGDTEQPNTTHMTALDAHLVFQYLRRMVDQGVQHVVLELTSHALDQHRLAGIALAGGIILNIKHEHLDYHRTMAAYAAAKAKIISYLQPQAPLVVNGEDEWIDTILKNSKFKIQNSKLTTHNVIKFTRKQATSVVTPLPGDFNQENVLAASLLAGALGIDTTTITSGVQTLRQVPGRVEWLKGPRGSRIVIDFALTPYSYERLFTYLRQETAGRLLAVFGAAGRRDQAKRPIIAATVARFADEIIITQDEPYDDPEAEIYAQLEAGLVDATIPWRRIEDRRSAIRYALQQVQANDVVAITGMGNFDRRMVGGQAVIWNDKAVTLELVQELTSNSSTT